MSRRRQVFLVAIEVDNRLPANMVKDYVEHAIKNYGKVALKGSPAYFDGIRDKYYMVREISIPFNEDGLPIKEELIREVTRIARTAKDFCDSLFRDIQDQEILAWWKRG